MVRTIMATKVLPKKYDISSGAVMNWPQSDFANQMRIRITGRTLFLVNNGTGVSAQVTIYSTPDLYGRVRNLVKTLANGEMWVSPMFPVQGWVQPDGYLYVDVSGIDMRLYALEIPIN